MSAARIPCAPGGSLATGAPRKRLISSVVRARRLVAGRSPFSCPSEASGFSSYQPNPAANQIKTVQTKLATVRPSAVSFTASNISRNIWSTRGASGIDPLEMASPTGSQPNVQVRARFCGWGRLSKRRLSSVFEPKPIANRWLERTAHALIQCAACRSVGARLMSSGCDSMCALTIASAAAMASASPCR
jgi:hypothetical protein